MSSFRFLRLLFLFLLVAILLIDFSECARDTDPKGYYKALGVSKDTSHKNIKKAYRKLAIQYHPDKNPDNVDEATEKFKEIAEAYDVLGNEKKRKRYDHGRLDFGNFHDPFDMFQDFFSDDFGDDLFNGHFKGFGGFGGDDMFGDIFKGFGGFGDGGGDDSMFGGGVFSSSTSTTYMNGKMRTTKTINQNGKQIKEVWEDNELIEKVIDGIKQPLEAIGGKNDL